MGRKKNTLGLIVIGAILCLSLSLICLLLSTQQKTTYISSQTTQTQINTLTAKYGDRLSKLIQTYEQERWDTSLTADLLVTVTDHYVQEYTDTRCQVYAAVAINSPNLHNDYDDRPCGFCAVYVFVRAGPREPWEFGTFLPIMWSADDLVRDWKAHEEFGTYEGYIDSRPKWESCPYWLCTVKE